MLLQQDRPLWQANYKSMSAQQLVEELARIAKHPHLIDEPTERKAFIAGELARTRGNPMMPIIVMEGD